METIFVMAVLYLILRKSQEFPLACVRLLEAIHSRIHKPNHKPPMIELPKKEDYVTPRMISETTGLSYPFIHKLIVQGDLPAVKYSSGGKKAHYLVLKADFVKWFEERQTIKKQ